MVGYCKSKLHMEGGFPNKNNINTNLDIITSKAKTSEEEKANKKTEK